MPDIVLVDDDDEYREVLSADLGDRGFSVSCFADGRSLLEAMKNGVEAEIALLDWVLTEMTGFALFGLLREQGNALPVVFLTGHSPTERELLALDHGAVDFIDKSRGTDVLAHRLRLIIEGQRRRAGATGAVVGQVQVEDHGELALHRGTARALWRGQDVGLTVTEYKIVTLLVSHKGTFHTYRALYDAAHFTGFIAGSGERGYATNVRSLVKRIRKKFLAVDTDFSAIENVQRYGYRWLDPQV